VWHGRTLSDGDAFVRAIASSEHVLTATERKAPSVSENRIDIAMSLDGYVAGPDQSVENPLGVGGTRLHEWAFALESWRKAHGQEGGEVNASTAFAERLFENVGAAIMGRNMFGGGPGPWSAGEPWDGWWGEDPPYHMPVFVLTHHPRETLVLQGGTSFTFVTDGMDAALAQAREAAGGQDISITGGADTCRQFLRAGLVDRLTIHLVPVLLGSGEALLDGVGPDVRLELIGVTDAPGVTHLEYRVVR
jgi:dihydrofolate reductase